MSDIEGQVMLVIAHLNHITELDWSCCDNVRSRIRDLLEHGYPWHTVVEMMLWGLEVGPK